MHVDDLGRQVLLIIVCAKECIKLRNSYLYGASLLAMSLGAHLALAQTNVPLSDPIPDPVPIAPIKLSLETVMTGFVSPVAAAVAPGDDDHLYVVDQPGQLWRVPVLGTSAPATLVLDVGKRLVPLGLPPLNYDERGFLGLAFHPDFKRNGLFYTFTSEPASGKADFTTLSSSEVANCQSVVTEWHVQGQEGNWRGDAPFTVDPNSARVLLRIDKPQFNHNGGALTFGRGGLLYISLGDGGNANDSGPGHVPGGNAQSLTPGNVLGKILRIDPLGRNSANGRYGIPSDNHFARNASGAHEIYAYGLRNPFRIAYDRETDTLVAGDVGQNSIEEVDVIRKGGNYGWPIKEGTFLFDGGDSRPAPNTGIGFVYADSPGRPAGLIDPVAEYDHVDAPATAETRVAVIGGYIYRGQQIAYLRGRYVFGDYFGETGSPISGHILLAGGANHNVEDVKITGRENGLGLAVLGFGQDSKGELYLLGNQTGTLNGQTGQLLRFGPAR